MEPSADTAGSAGSAGAAGAAAGEKAEWDPLAALAQQVGGWDGRKGRDHWKAKKNEKHENTRPFVHNVQEVSTKVIQRN